MKLIPAILLVGSLLTSVTAWGGIVVGGTRLIYPDNKNEVQISLSNKDLHSRHLVQSWVNNTDDSKAPFIVTPPLIKLDEGKETLLHVIYVGDPGALPQNKESLFWLNVKSVAGVPDELKDKNRLQLAVHTRIKLFWRPSGLNNHDASSAYEKLTFTRAGNTLHVNNPTPFYVSFNALKVGDRDVTPADKSVAEAAAMMAAPFASASFVIPAGASGPVTWSAINDFGGVTKVARQPL